MVNNINTIYTIDGVRIKILGAAHDPNSPAMRIVILVDLTSSGLDGRYKKGYVTATGSVNKWMAFYISSGLCSGTLLKGNINPIVCCCLVNSKIMGQQEPSYDQFLNTWAYQVQRNPEYEPNSKNENFLKNFRSGIESVAWIAKCGSIETIYNDALRKDPSLSNIYNNINKCKKIFDLTYNINSRTRIRICNNWFLKLNDILKGKIVHSPVNGNPSTWSIQVFDDKLGFNNIDINIFTNLQIINELIKDNTILGVNLSRVTRKYYLKKLVFDLKKNNRSSVKRLLNHSKNFTLWHNKYFKNQALPVLEDGYDLPTNTEVMKKIQKVIETKTTRNKNLRMISPSTAIGQEIINANKRGNAKTMRSLLQIRKKVGKKQSCV